MKITLLLLFSACLTSLPLLASPLNALSALASASKEGHVPEKAIDGVVSDGSRWVAEADTGWLEIRLEGTHKIAGLHLHSGYGNGDAVSGLNVSFWTENHWKDIPSATITGNQAVALALPFDSTVEVVTDRLRLEITSSPKKAIRIKEVVVWPVGQGDMPALPQQKASALAASSLQADIPLIYLNQSGFNIGKPKRFTAPTLAGGTPFIVRPVHGSEAVFEGAIQKNIGDFSRFNPESSGEFVVEAGGLVSVPFRIGCWWIERVSYQNTIDFMIDSRHHVGNDRTPCVGSFGWRDDHHFAWELHGLVAQWLSNPSAYERMRRQIRYEAPDERKLWGALEPYREDAPDIVKLIHWGADIIVTQKLSHELLKSQLAYFLYAWPWMQKWLPPQNYQMVRDYAFAVWSEPEKDRSYPYDASPEHDLLALKTKIGGTKGELPPGFSVEPNLLMHEVAKREMRADAAVYFEAAHRQAEWLIVNLDWNDPSVTKGQRMSEFLTITGLVYFLREYPERAPEGLAGKIDAWADVVIRRSENLWDFRKLGDAADAWTPTGEKPTMWNEPGNVVGLAGVIFAALPWVGDGGKRDRLEQIAWAQIDQLFGRNPVGRHFSFDAPREVEGVEHGWFKFYPGGIGRLAEARFVIDGSPKNAHYPYHPEIGDIGWTEGWIQHNLPYNLSLAYLAHADTRLELNREGNAVVVRLHAPLNFDETMVESGLVEVITSNGDRELLTVTEESSNREFLMGRIPMAVLDSTQTGDGVLQVSAGAGVTASYGWGYLKKSSHMIP